MSKELPKQNRVFKGIWIPKEIWLNTDLTPIEKLLIVEIDSLDNDDAKGCYASNEYFGNFFGMTEGRIANMISSLKKRGYLFQVFFDGRNRGLRIHEKVKAGFTKDGVSFHEKVKAGFTKRGKRISRKSEDNNTVNNPSNNTEREKAKTKKMPTIPETFDEMLSEVERLAVEAKKEKAPSVAPAPLTIHSGFNDVFDTLYEKDENGEYRPRKDSEPKQPEEFEIEVFEPVKRERVTVPKPKKDDPYVTPQKATGHKIICETADEANDLITAWTACNIATVENWYNRSKRVISAVDLQNIITKFCGNYANHWDSGKRLRFLADPVLFFRNQCSGWLIDQNKFDREQAAKAAQPRAGFNQPTETKHTAPVSTAPVAKLYHK